MLRWTAGVGVRPAILRASRRWIGRFRPLGAGAERSCYGAAMISLSVPPSQPVTGLDMSTVALIVAVIATLLALVDVAFTIVVWRWQHSTRLSVSVMKAESPQTGRVGLLLAVINRGDYSVEVVKMRVRQRFAIRPHRFFFVSGEPSHPNQRPLRVTHVAQAPDQAGSSWPSVVQFCQVLGYDDLLLDPTIPARSSRRVELDLEMIEEWFRKKGIGRNKRWTFETLTKTGEVASLNLPPLRRMDRMTTSYNEVLPNTSVLPRWLVSRIHLRMSDEEGATAPGPTKRSSD